MNRKPCPLPALALLAMLPSAVLAQDMQALLTQLWQAQSFEQQARSRLALEAASSDVNALFQLVQAGPSYSPDVATGVVTGVRIADDGRRFPYALLIPESYDAARAYPVEFMLHGGVGRPARPEGETLWRGGYDNLRREDRIVVVPAGWSEAYWWQDSQADNVAEILRRVKRDYHVDDDRVVLGGVSDGGTGAYFFAFKQPTQWSAFLAYIGHPAVLRNPQSGGGHRLYFENLMNKPLYIVNGEVDRLYPAESVQPFIEVLQQAEIEHVFRVIEDGGHNTRWLPEETPAIEAFKQENPRDPLPEKLNWIADRVDRYNRNHWLVIDELSDSKTPGIIEVHRDGNAFTVSADAISRFTLLLNPEEVDLNQSVSVVVDGETVYDGMVEPSAATLLDWLQRDLDRSLLFTASLTISL